MRKSSGIAWNTKDDKKVLVTSLVNSFFERLASSYSAMSSSTVKVQVCRDSQCADIFACQSWPCWRRVAWPQLNVCPKSEGRSDHFSGSSLPESLVLHTPENASYLIPSRKGRGMYSNG